jgi:hypothetical protein
MEDDALNGSSMWKAAAIAFGMIAVGACAYSFMLYSALATDLAAAKNDVNLAHNELENLRSELSSMEERANSQEEQQLQITKARLAAQVRRDLPIELTFHDADLRSGKVALLHNLSDADLEVMLEVRRPASDQHVRRPLVINAHGMLQVGAAQGWHFTPGEIVTLNNDKYRPLVRIVS